MTESIQKTPFTSLASASNSMVDGTTMCAERPVQSDAELAFWRFAAEQYGIWLDHGEWRELAQLDDHLLIARRYFWRLSDPEVHELLCAVPDPD